MLDRKTVAVVHRLGKHAGVAAAGAIRRHALLDHGDRGGRVEGLEEERGPEAGEARPDDHDVGVPAALEHDCLAWRTPREPVAGLLDGLHGLSCGKAGQCVPDVPCARSVRCCQRTVAPSRMRLASRIAVASTLIWAGKAARRAP